MSDLEALTKRLQQEPGNCIVAAMLTDELISDKDMTRAEADRAVAAVIATASAAEELESGAALMVPGTFTHRLFSARIRESVQLFRGAPHTIVVVPGPEGPNLRQHEQQSEHGWARHSTITVGAGWLLLYWRDYKSCQAIDNRFRAMTRKKKKKK